MRTYHLLDFLFPGKRRAKRTGRGPLTGQEAIAAALFNTRAAGLAQPPAPAAPATETATAGATRER